jgi:glycosyltransferase involved in cell wall biosynthesis
MMDRPLRFCMITTFYPPYNFGGDGIFVRRLSNELARRGHQVDVIHCIDAYRTLARHEPAKICDNDCSVRVHGLRSPFAFLSPLATQQTGYPFFKSGRLRQILKKGFDVIHYHNISLVGGPKILKYGRGIKLYTMHEYWLVCPTHVMFRFGHEPCRRPRCFACTLAYRRPPQWWRYLGLMKAAVRHVDAFISPSRFNKDKHHQMGLDVRIEHVPYFIPPVGGGSRISRKAVEGRFRKPYFLFVGRLEKIKGLQTLFRIFRHYGKAQLLVAGRGGYEARLRQLAHGNVNVRFLGHLPERQLQALYDHAMAVLVPSICFDVFPNVILEAFRQKTPAIVRRLGGMPEFIEESGAGFVYNTDEELVTAMNKLLADPSYQSELGLRGYRAYQRKWTAEAHLERYFALINEIAKTRPRTVG